MLCHHPVGLFPDDQLKTYEVVLERFPASQSWSMVSIESILVYRIVYLSALSRPLFHAALDVPLTVTLHLLRLSQARSAALLAMSHALVVHHPLEIDDVPLYNRYIHRRQHEIAVNRNFHIHRRPCSRERRRAAVCLMARKSG